MTDDELLQLLHDRYPSLYDRLTESGWESPASDSIADLRRLMAAQVLSSEKLLLQAADRLRLVGNEEDELLAFELGDLLNRAAALQQSREKEKCDE